MLTIRAPGKLIISGEHAVVYGHPALAMAVNRYVIAKAEMRRLPFVTFDFSDLDYKQRMSYGALSALKHRLQDHYQGFLRGEFSIRDVLQKPVDLAQLAFGLFLDSFPKGLRRGLRLHLSSTIPMGCGMGSSAATVLSVLVAMSRHFQVEIPETKLIRMAEEAENMQHGRTSGLDIRVSLQGGASWLEQGVLSPRPLPQLPFYLVNTGQPESSTGECVMQAKSFFTSSSIGNDFAETTRALDHALQAEQYSETQTLVRRNQALLQTIGVVPERVQAFITRIELLGGAAKICGAGAVRGECAGVVLVLIHDVEALMQLCGEYAYTVLPIQGVAEGVQVV